MATYAIGDVQGCSRTLGRLVRRIRFDPDRDRLWLVGDMVNRGPRSLEVLRWARSLQDRVVAVLGNHDLHLIARARGVGARKPSDTIDDVLGAPDRDELIDWLCGRPFLHREGEFVLVHAGLLPAWSAEEAERLAGDLESAARGGRLDELLPALYRRDRWPAWRRDLSGRDRLVLAAAALTRLRTCTRAGRLCDYSGPPDRAPRGCFPWFDAPDRRSRSETVVFGHWSAMGLRIEPRIMALDTGCVWGGMLTAIRLEDREVFQEPLSD